MAFVDKSLSTFQRVYFKLNMLHTQAGIGGFGRLGCGFRLVASVLLLLAIQTVRDAPVAFATEQLPAVSGHLAILEDPSLALSLADVLRPEHDGRFLPVIGGDISLGITRSAYWLRLSLPSGTDAAAILTMSPNFLDAVDIYSAAPGQGRVANDYRLTQTGDHRPPINSGISAIADAVRVEFKDGETTRLYVRILNTNSATQARFHLSRVEDFASDLSATTLGFGVWFGGMIVLIFVQLVFYQFDRKLIYPLIAVRTLSLMLLYFGNFGLSRALLFPQNGPANDVFIGACGWGALCVFAVTNIKLLELDRKSTFLHRVYLLIAGGGLIGIVFASLHLNLDFAPFGSVLAALAAMLSLVISLWYAREDGVASLLRAAAFMVLVSGSIVSIMQRVAVWDMPNWVFHVYGVAGLIHIVLLTGVLAVRLRDAERRERIRNSQALEAAQSAERMAAALVEERTAELNEARRAAESALQAEMQSQIQQVRFLEVLSHQYRTPLSAIRTSADSIALSLRKGDEVNRSRIERIRQSVIWLVQILETNLQRSLLQGASIQPEPAPVTAGSMLRAAFKRSQDLLNDPDIRLDIDDSVSEIVLLVDAAMIELAIVNLLENAVKYTALKGSAPVTLSLVRDQIGVAIVVRDHGIGIPTDDLPHVLQNGVRGANASGAEGSGLGLSMVARIVAAHAGSLELKSVEGEGTTAKIILPVAADAG
ncbi:sensor histidine kinase [Rhizobium sp. RU36D]|uniref:sensor histidine kinase n=1 Tax=Rhizobium sp. RU36D TaxID=1907415 RepID=UPI0009D7D612|nr:sensor histidine kinase [Rhizobium sp. RU36D]SMD00269.1 7TM diverse intracellular signalling [Rhizobium sp. RU36D]